MENIRFLPFALIFTGAGLGGILRYALTTVVARQTGPAFPYGTLAVNIVAGFILGALVGYWAGQGASPMARLFFVTGLLGGFSTFSAFTLETVLLVEKNQLSLALVYILASVAGAMVSLVIGLWLGRYLAA